MKLEQHPVLDRLAEDARCLGAAFTTFTFDPAFFEQHVLAAVLRVSADPDEAAAAYHEQALAALQETPVVCFVDGNQRPSGHQLPYDLREIRDRCFHPKVTLLLYERGARLSVGSGNLTRPGLGGNAETFFLRDLAYDRPEDAAILREVAGFFRALDQRASTSGTQTSAFLDTLARRLAATPVTDAPAQFAFLHTEADRPLLTQLLDLLPASAKITRIGVLAPFFERDDLADDPGEDLSSVLMGLVARAGKDTVLDLGVSWDDASIYPGGVAPIAVREGMEQLWARKERDAEDREVVRYFVPVGETAGKYRVVDRKGDTRLLPKDELDTAVAEHKAWLVGRPRIYAPASLVAAARRQVSSVRTWLFPSPQLIDDHKLTRPLHAKLFVITYRAGTKIRTLVMIGSANASRMAMLKTPEGGGNVEACIAYIVDDELDLRDLARELTLCAAPVDWQERTFETPPPLPTIPMVEAAIYDARTATLTITWQPPPPDLGAWHVRYQQQGLGVGDGPPTGPLTVHPFELRPASCEVFVGAHDGEYSFPITVQDLSALPLGDTSAAPDLRALLAMLGRRLTPTRHRSIQEQHGRAMVEATLDTILGEGFAPTDVFRAWWNVASDLATEGISVAGFRLRLLGSLGPATVWTKLCEVAQEPGSGVRSEEVWFYGAELLRTLRVVELPEDVDQAPKQALLTEFLDQLTSDLVALQPASSERPWVAQIVNFYTKGPTS